MYVSILIACLGWFLVLPFQDYNCPPVYLQIFNSKLVLASPETATDADYSAILGVIGHEVCNFYNLRMPEHNFPADILFPPPWARTKILKIISLL